LSDVSLTEPIVAFERNDLGIFAIFMEARPQSQIQSAHAPRSDEQLMLVIERKNSGQSDYGGVMFESIQIKAILNPGLKPF
jgi:hypothetical protein